MGTLIKDSFDFYSAVADAAGYWTSLGSGILSGPTRFGVGQSLGTPTTLNQTTLSGVFAYTSGNTIYISFSHTMTQAANPAGSTNCEMRFYDGNTIQMGIMFSEEGTLYFRLAAAGSVIATYAGAFAGSSTWNRFEIKMVIDNSVGEIEIRKNGNLVADFTATGLDTQQSANARVTRMDCICRNSATNRQYFDDLWIYDETVVGAEPVSWLGDVRAVQIMPVSDQSITWTPSTGVVNYVLVDELINSAADYVSSITPGNVDLYSNSGFGIYPTQIVNVTVRALALKENAGLRQLSARAVSGATASDGATVSLATTSLNVYNSMELDPDTAGPWNATSVASLLFGPHDRL